MSHVWVLTPKFMFNCKCCYSNGSVPEGVAFFIHIPAEKDLWYAGKAFHHFGIVLGDVGIIEGVAIGNCITVKQYRQGNHYPKNKTIPLKIFAKHKAITFLPA